MLASEILRRIIPGPTTTAVRAFPGGADAGTFSAGGLLMPGDLSCGDVDASDVSTATAAVTTALAVLGGVGVGAYKTQVIDLRTAPATFALNAPLAAGKTFLPMPRMLLHILTRDAALTTAPLVTMQQNGSDLTAAAGPTTGQCNNRAAPSIFDFPINISTVDVSSFGLDVRLTTAAAGAGLAACTGVFYLWGIYV